MGTTAQRLQKRASKAHQNDTVLISKIMKFIIYIEPKKEFEQYESILFTLCVRRYIGLFVIYVLFEFSIESVAIYKIIYIAED